MPRYRLQTLVALATSGMLVSACASGTLRGLPTSLAAAPADSPVVDLGNLVDGQRPTGQVRLDVGLSTPARTTQAFPATVKKLQLRVTDEALSNPFSPIVQPLAHDPAHATESISFNVPVATVTITVDALNADDTILGQASSSSVAITAGAYTTLSLTLTPWTGNVAGTIVDGDTHAALAGVEVTIGATRTTTDASGSFEIDDLPPGVTTVSYALSLTGSATCSSTVIAGVTTQLGNVPLPRQHWFPLLPGTTSRFWGVQALSANDVVVWGEDSYLTRTADGGTSWTQIPLADNSASLRSVRFANATTGWALTVDGKLYRTTDGGWNWTRGPLTIDTGDDCDTGYGIALFGANEASIFGASGSTQITAYTADASTPSVSVTGQAVGYSISPVGTSSVLAIGTADDTIYSSTHYGDTWGHVSVSGFHTDASYAPNALYAKSLTEAYVVGHDTAGYPVVMRTTTGGAGWSALFTSASPLVGNLGYRAITRWGTDGLAVVGAKGSVAMRKSGSSTWHETPVQAETPTSVMLNDVSFFDESHGWAVGDDGQILRY